MDSLHLLIAHGLAAKAALGHGLAHLVVAGITITPNNSLPGTAEFERLLGGLVSAMQIVAAMGFVGSLGIWTVSHHGGAGRYVDVGRRGAIVSFTASVGIAATAAILTFAGIVGKAF
jgi:hypothetical protein